MDSDPKIVIIDDHIEELSPLNALVKERGASFTQVVFPADVDEELLKDADLVVVDFTLSGWIDNVDVDQVALKPRNGVALASVLRQHCANLRDFPPTGFALITGQPEKLGAVPSERRPHVISRLNNFEWFFEKRASEPSVAERNADQIISLASAIKSLPNSVGKDLGTIESLLEYLGIHSDNELFERFSDSVQRCRPPIHHLAQASHGLIVLRWLLHRILPYTTFLVGNLGLAARLRVEPSWLNAELSSESSLKTELGSYQYAGPLSNFDGRRFWREGVEQHLWNVTEGNSSNSEAIHEYLEKCCGSVDKLALKRPVVTLDHKLQVENVFSESDDVLPILLDDWPSYAEPAYIRKTELASNQAMNMFLDEAN